MSDTVLLSLGHPLRSDDGFGERLLQLFEQRFEPSTASRDRLLCLHGGTRPLAHYPRIAGCRWLILLDAVQSANPAGSVVVLDPFHSTDPLRPLAVHQLGVDEMLRLMDTLGEAPQRVSLVGATFASLDWGQALSSMLEASVPMACERLAKLLNDNALPLVQRQQREETPCTN